MADQERKQLQPGVITPKIIGGDPNTQPLTELPISSEGTLIENGHVPHQIGTDTDTLRSLPTLSVPSTDVVEFSTTGEVIPRVSQGLGRVIAEGHPQGEQVRTAIPLIHINFVNPHHVLPKPYGDAYLGQLGILTAGEEEAVLIHALVPGHEAYLREIGLVKGVSVIEVRQRVNRTLGQGAFGFPYGDPLETLKSSVGEDGKVYDSQGRPYMLNNFVLIPALTNSGVLQQAGSLGIQTLAQPGSDAINSKALLREAAGKYGIPMPPGALITAETDLSALVERLLREWGDGEVFVKFPTGAGGDLGEPEPDFLEQTLRKAIRNLRELFLASHRNGQFGITGKEVWPEGLLAPHGFPLVVERHAKALGNILVIGSNYFTTRVGSRRPHNVSYFRQFTHPVTGDFLGSGKYYPPGSIKDLIDEATERTAENSLDMEYYGIQGIDYIIVDTGSGIKLFVIERNGRIIISTFSDIVGERLGIPEWMNINATLDRDVETFDDFVGAVGEELIWRPGKNSGIISLGFRTVIGEEEIIPSPHCKIFIAGNEKQQSNIVKQLETKGIQMDIKKKGNPWIQSIL